MKPYCAIPNKYMNVIGSKSYDWPSTKRWALSHRSHRSEITHKKYNNIAKRIRRRVEKQNLNTEIKDI